MKKMISLLLTALMIAGVLACAPITASALVFGNFEYTVNDGTATVTNYTGAGPAVVIPDEMDGYKVTAIGLSAFYQCDAVESVSIPDSVTLIDDTAFCYCSNLKSVTVPENVTVIDFGAFKGCKKLESVTIKGKLELIQEEVFKECISLTSVQLPDSVKKISTKAFASCTGLEEITIPDSVTEIEESAFSNCEKLSKLKLPAGLITIGNGAFSGCTELTEVDIPDGTVDIGERAFSGCTKLESLIIPLSVKNIREEILENCTGFKTVYYIGDDYEWGEVIGLYIGDYAPKNTVLKSAEIICNYVPAGYCPVMFIGPAYVDMPERRLVKLDDKVEKPADPSGEYIVDGELLYTFSFEGWYEDEECTVEYDFSKPVTNDTLIYAKLMTKASFDVGGHGTAPPEQPLRCGETVTKPADPECEGMKFEGWYTDKECTTEYIFSEPVTVAVTLYAKWSGSYTVTFDENGHGEAPDPQNVAEGALAYEPTAPTAEGFTFGGWYTDEECTMPFSFGTAVTENITLYAMWIKYDPIVYDMTINSVQVTSENRNDILGDGVFSFDGDKTLTISGNGSYSSDILRSHIDGLIIDVASDSELTTTDTAFWLERSTVFRGNGHKLTITTTPKEGYAYYGIFACDYEETPIDLIIEDITLVINADNPLLCNYSFASLSFKNVEAELNAPDEESAIKHFANRVSFEGCYLEAPAEISENDSVTDKEGKSLNKVIIKKGENPNPTPTEAKTEPGAEPGDESATEPGEPGNKPTEPDPEPTTPGQTPTEAAPETNPSEKLKSFFFLPDSSQLISGYSFKLAVQDSNGAIVLYDMTETDKSVNDVRVFEAKVPENVEIALLMFQVFDGNSFVSQTDAFPDQAENNIIKSDGSTYSEESENKNTVEKKKKNPIKVTVKKKNTLKKSKLKSKKQSVKALRVTKNKGSLTYKITSVPKKIKKLVKISSKGVITFAKGKYAAGKYKIKVSVTAKGTKTYKPGTVKKTVNVTIK